MCIVIYIRHILLELKSGMYCLILHMCIVEIICDWKLDYYVDCVT